MVGSRSVKEKSVSCEEAEAELQHTDSVRSTLCAHCGLGPVLRGVMSVDDDGSRVHTDEICLHDVHGAVNASQEQCPTSDLEASVEDLRCLLCWKYRQTPMYVSGSHTGKEGLSGSYAAA